MKPQFFNLSTPVIAFEGGSPVYLVGFSDRINPEEFVFWGTQSYHKLDAYFFCDNGNIDWLLTWQYRPAYQNLLSDYQYRDGSKTAESAGYIRALSDHGLLNQENLKKGYLNPLFLTTSQWQNESSGCDHPYQLCLRVVEGKREKICLTCAAKFKINTVFTSPTVEFGQVDFISLDFKNQLFTGHEKNYQSRLDSVLRNSHRALKEER
jgi:hypothetical protein